MTAMREGISLIDYTPVLFWAWLGGDSKKQITPPPSSGFGMTIEQGGCLNDRAVIKIPNRSERGGMWNPRPSSAALLRVVVNGCRRAPASASAVAAGVAVEPDIERIRGVGGSEARPSKRERRAFTQRTKEGVL